MQKYSEDEILSYGVNKTQEEKQDYYDFLIKKYKSEKFAQLVTERFIVLHPILVEFAYHFFCDMEEKDDYYEKYKGYYGKWKLTNHSLKTLTS